VNLRAEEIGNPLDAMLAAELCGESLVAPAGK